MKISTKDCIEKIIEKHGTKFPWKRVSKKRISYHEDYSDAVYWLREFSNKKNSEIAFVWATDENIVEIRILTPSSEKVDGLIEKDNRNGYMRYDIDELDFATVPLVKLREYEDEGESESSWEELDFENFEIESTKDNEVVIRHGGDWQEPVSVTYRLMSDGKLYYSTTEKCKE